MTTLHAHPKTYVLDALQRQRRELLDIPAGEIGNILLEGGTYDGDIMLAENGDTLQHDGSLATVLVYILHAHRHTYILDALARTQEEVVNTFAQSVRAGLGEVTVTGYDVAFEWQYATTVPAGAIQVTGLAPTATATVDSLGVEAGGTLLLETGDKILLDI